MANPPNLSRRKQLHEAAEASATLVPEHSGAVLRGQLKDGIDYICGKCHATIAERVHGDQFFDFGVICAQCKTLVAFDQLPPGRPLPSFKTVVLNDGKYRLSATINTGEDIVMVGEGAVRQRIHEVGHTGTASVGATPLDEDFLRKLISNAKDLLGDRYEGLAASNARGKTSPTPPTNPHRLLELIDAASTAADSFKEDTPEIDAVATAELHSALGSFERWKNDPCWPEIVTSISDPRSFLHAVVLLVIASYLTDAGNGVELVRGPGTQRMADMRIHVTAEIAVNTEVKTPAGLIRPEKALTLDSARTLVRDQMSSAKTSAGGQLDPSSPGLLIIGGFGVREGDVTVLRIAAREELQRKGGRAAHVLGIALVSLGAVVETPVITGGLLTLTGAAHAEIVQNPRYEGTVALRTEPARGMRDLPDTRPLAHEGEQKKMARNAPCWCGSGKKFKTCHGA